VRADPVVMVAAIPTTFNRLHGEPLGVVRAYPCGRCLSGLPGVCPGDRRAHHRV